MAVNEWYSVVQETSNKVVHLRVSESWDDFHFWVSYPFKDKMSPLNLIKTAMCNQFECIFSVIE